MKIIEVITLIETDPYPATNRALDEIHDAINKVHWPPGSNDFAIHPESGRKPRKGNGVGPIRRAFITALAHHGWETEAEFPFRIDEADSSQLGNMDAAKRFGSAPPFSVEWETGNISSSHRAMNKMSVGLIEGCISAGVLIVPSTKLKTYLTDRVGNVRELRPYLSLWAHLNVERGYLGIIVVEHDRIDRRVRRIKKGTDGRALL